MLQPEEVSMRFRNIILAALAGAAVAYLFDPIAGSARRSRLRRRITALMPSRAFSLEERGPLPENMAPAPAAPVVGTPVERPGEAGDSHEDESLVHLPESETISSPTEKSGSSPLGDAWNG
jgi:hypothetical protein